MDWIKESIKKSKILKDHYKLHDIDVFIKDKFTNDLDFDFCLKQVANKIPSYLMSGIDIIYVGDFEMFKEREINALYQDGAIYVSNKQDNFDDMVDDIVHEISHSIEKKYFDIIYDDQS